MSKNRLWRKPYARPPDWSCSGAAQAFHTSPGDAWPITAAWHPIRAFYVWHLVSDIFEHSNSRENPNFFSLFFISRKNVTVTFKDFLKTCGGDAYPDAKRNRMCNYSLLAALQVSDNGWLSRPNASSIDRYYTGEYMYWYPLPDSPVCLLTIVRFAAATRLDHCDYHAGTYLILCMSNYCLTFFLTS